MHNLGRGFLSFSIKGKTDEIFSFCNFVCTFLTTPISTRMGCLHKKKDYNLFVIQVIYLEI